MKQHILTALRLTLVCIIFFCGIYSFVIFGIAQFAPNKGNGETIQLNNKVVGYVSEGQNFSSDKYFWGRPSAVGYNAATSGGSNKGPSNPDYLKDLQSKIDTFLAHNPEIKKEEIPADLVTASGSGLDPDLSPASAYVQVARVAKARNIDKEKIKSLVESNVEKPLLGLLGPEKVNVLKLNIALDNLK